ncbi:MAG: hypothetical protein H3C34_05125 [Caldilineaceae bacterium]|nr:hypothetical protein [Caldilineaceae bacterium]
MTTIDIEPAHDPQQSAGGSASQTQGPVDAHCYMFNSASGRQRATLWVLLDSQRHALRAELQLDAALNEAERLPILRRAENILRNDYLGAGDRTPFTVMTTQTAGLPQEVEHSGVDPLFVGERSYPLWPIAGGIAALFVLVLVLAWISNFVLGGNTGATPVAVAQPFTAPLAQEALPAGQPAQTFAPSVPSTTSLEPETNGLPASRNADNRLAVGMRVRIRSGLRSFVRSDPGPDAGQALGYLQNGEVATLAGGPKWLPGETDTIVWWYVHTESGLSGWTPANTSQLTLLEPVEE